MKSSSGNERRSHPCHLYKDGKLLLLFFYILSSFLDSTRRNCKDLGKEGMVFVSLDFPVRKNGCLGGFRHRTHLDFVSFMEKAALWNPGALCLKQMWRGRAWTHLTGWAGATCAQKTHLVKAGHFSCLERKKKTRQKSTPQEF